MKRRISALEVLGDNCAIKIYLLIYLITELLAETILQTDRHQNEWMLYCFQLDTASVMNKLEAIQKWVEICHV